MNSFELYSGTGKSVALIDCNSFESWEAARAAFKQEYKGRLRGTCLVMERVEETDSYEIAESIRHTIRFS